MNFAVVEIKERLNFCAIVHSSWLRNGNKTYWPPYWRNNSKLEKSVQRGEIVNTETWSLYDVRVFAYYESYEKARLKLPKSLETSNLDSESGGDDNLGRGKRVKFPKRISEVSIDSISSNESVQTSAKIRKKKCKGSSQLLGTPPALSSTPVTPTLVQYPGLDGFNIAESDQDYRIQTFDESDVMQADPTNTSLPFNLAMAVIPTNPQCTINSETETRQTTSNFIATVPGTSVSSINIDLPEREFRKEVLQELKSTGIKIDEALRLLRGLAPSGYDGTDSNSTANPEVELPLESAEDIRKMETLLQKKDERRKLIRQLSNLGGETVNKATYRVLAMLLKDELASLYSFAGQKHGNAQKKSFSALHMMDCVISAVKMGIPGNQWNSLQIEEAIKYWLKKAPTRLDSKNKNKARLPTRSAPPNSAEIPVDT